MRESQLSKKQLIKLTNQWYSKLKADGFTDIEWYDPQTGKGQNADWLKNSAYKMRHQFNSNTQEHFRIITNFTTHYNFPLKRDKFILELYADGVTYRRIIEKCRTKGNGYGYKAGKRSLSLLTLHNLIKKYVGIAYEWNRNDVNGLEYRDSQDIETESMTD